MTSFRRAPGISGICCGCSLPQGMLQHCGITLLLHPFSSSYNRMLSATVNTDDSQCFLWLIPLLLTICWSYIGSTRREEREARHLLNTFVLCHALQSQSLIGRAFCVWGHVCVCNPKVFPQVKQSVMPYKNIDWGFYTHRDITAWRSM